MTQEAAEHGDRDEHAGRSDEERAATAAPQGTASTADTAESPHPPESSAARAEAAIHAMASGANPAEEAFALSNRFTDDATAQLVARLRRLFRRSAK